MWHQKSEMTFSGVSLWSRYTSRRRPPIMDSMMATRVRLTYLGSTTSTRMPILKECFMLSANYEEGRRTQMFNILLIKSVKLNHSSYLIASHVQLWLVFIILSGIFLKQTLIKNLYCIFLLEKLRLTNLLTSKKLLKSIFTEMSLLLLV